MELESPENFNETFNLINSMSPQELIKLMPSVPSTTNLSEDQKEGSKEDPSKQFIITPLKTSMMEFSQRSSTHHIEQWAENYA